MAGVRQLVLVKRRNGSPGRGDETPVGTDRYWPGTLSFCHSPGDLAQRWGPQG